MDKMEATEYIEMKYSSMFDMCEDFSIGSGWVILVDACCAELEDHKVKVLQMKEKFGQLRIYLRAEDHEKDDVNNLVNRYEHLSGCYCDVCGGRGKLVNKEGTMMTRCENHLLR